MFSTYYFFEGVLDLDIGSKTPFAALLLDKAKFMNCRFKKKQKSTHILSEGEIERFKNLFL